MSFTSAPLPKLSRNIINIDTLPKPNPTSLKLQTPSLSPSPTPTPSPLTNPTPTPSLSSQHPKGNILHVSNICPRLTYEQIKKKLYDLFSVHGPIYEIVIKTKETGQHFAFVDFPNIADAEKAWLAAKNQGKRIENRRLMVNYCEDPKKNADRKDQKCFLCHGTGHKAIRCPVKPEMIKKKPKKIEQTPNEEDETNEPSIPTQKPVPREQSDQESDQSSEEEAYQRDPDYLRFLKLKKRLLEKKLRKKVRKMRKKRS